MYAIRSYYAQNGVKFIPIIQRHIGSDHTKDVIGCIKNSIRKNGVIFLLNTEVLEFTKNRVFVKTAETKKEITGKYIIVARNNFV